MLVPVVAAFLNLGYTIREKKINFVESYAQGTFPSKLVSMGQAVLMPTKWWQYPIWSIGSGELGKNLDPITSMLQSTWNGK